MRDCGGGGGIPTCTERGRDEKGEEGDEEDEVGGLHFCGIAFITCLGASV